MATLSETPSVNMPVKNLSCLNITDFVRLHKIQLEKSAVPDKYWPALFEKLKDEVFDAGGSFLIQRVVECSEDEEEDENESEAAGDNAAVGTGQSAGDATGGQGECVADTEGEYSWQVVVNREDGIDLTDGSHIYLIDHAWTYRVDEARRQLDQVDGLLSRMASIMDIASDAKNRRELVQAVMTEMWKYNQTYNIANATLGTDAAVPIWYIMDEFGSRVQHSDTPSFRLVPFYYVPTQTSFTIMWPITALQDGDEVTRDFVEGVTDPHLRQIRLTPWQPRQWTHLSYDQYEINELFLLKYTVHKTVPNLDMKFPALPQEGHIKVYTDVDQVSHHLTDECFEFVEDTESADILWTKEYLKDFKFFSEDTPGKLINQFPFEMVVTLKDMLAMVARRAPLHHPPSEGSLDTHPRWLATTYNLQTELPQFVSYFQHRQTRGLDNHWICKPCNLARGLDMHITDSLSYILHLLDTGPKIACKYLEDPVLWARPGVGAVKFDLRYAVMLHSVRPLQLYVHRRFLPRFANKPFTLNDLDDYETHFTVMTYKDGADVCKVRSPDFVAQWESQHPGHPWADVEATMFDVIKELFVAASSKDPPWGIGHSPQSRTVYGIDIILQWATDEKGEKCIQPVLLECNFGLDLTRLCEPHPTFCNEVFRTLFLDSGESDLVTPL